MTTPGELAVLREYEGRVWNLHKYALANGLATVDDVLAHAASQGRYSTNDLVTLVKRLTAEDCDAELDALVRSLRPDAFRLLVLLLANQPQRPGGVDDAIALLVAMVAHSKRGSVREAERMTLLHLFVAQGRREEFERYLAEFGFGRVDVAQIPLLRANLRNPFTTGSEDRQSPGVDAWLELVNRVYVRDGLETVDLAPGKEPPLDRLMCAPSSLVEDGPLVTVIIPTRNPGPSLTMAMEGLLGQSYRPLEILVMDDGSRPEVGLTLHRWETRDARVRVVNLTENRGNYFARNVAVSRYARGEFVTVHDDDDWSHPRKIELQVAGLMADPDAPANMSLAMRVTANLWFDRRNSTPALVYPNFSSLMIRRSAMDELGYWDVVNRAADSEMRDRIVAWSGRPIPAVGHAPASMQVVRQDSLSNGEIYQGYLDPRRRWYMMAYTLWHEQALASGDGVHLPPDDSPCRPFPAPLDMLGSRANRPTTHVDILYATDYRFPGGNSTLSCNEIEVLLDHGLVVGLLQLDSPILGSASRLHTRASRLASHPNARVLTQLDDTAARLVIVRHPTVLQFLSSARLPVSAPHVVLIVNHTPINPDGRSAHYDIATAVANCQAAFGRTPVVAPESALIRTLLDGLIDAGLLSAEDWNGIVPLSPGESRRADPSRRPVIGRHSRDQLEKWPAADVLPVVYPTDGSRDVRILGGAGFAEVRLGKPVDGVWTVYPFGSKPASEFLGELDFWVYFHGPDLYESFGMAAVEAMAAGLVVILPYAMEANFGDGALYGDPADVARIIDRLWADPEEYAAQSARAIRTVQERFGEAALLTRVEQYLEPAADNRVV
ncbi:MAG TPA: glycosyltransferase [Propionicimonas sp.]